MIDYMNTNSKTTGNTNSTDASKNADKTHDKTGNAIENEQDFNLNIIDDVYGKFGGYDLFEDYEDRLVHDSITDFLINVFNIDRDHQHYTARCLHDAYDEKGTKTTLGILRKHADANKIVHYDDASLKQDLIDNEISPDYDASANIMRTINTDMTDARHQAFDMIQNVANQHGIDWLITVCNSGCFKIMNGYDLSKIIMIQDPSSDKAYRMIRRYGFYDKVKPEVYEACKKLLLARARNAVESFINEYHHYDKKYKDDEVFMNTLMCAYMARNDINDVISMSYIYDSVNPDDAVFKEYVSMMRTLINDGCTPVDSRMIDLYSETNAFDSALSDTENQDE